MEKFNKTLRGYDTTEVNEFLDNIIKQVETMVAEINDKEKQITELSANNTNLSERLTHYEGLEETLNKAILMAQKTSDQMKVNARLEAEIIIEDSKKTASRIVNDALIRAERTEYETSLLKKNINVFKRRLKDIIDAQLEVIDTIDKTEL